MKMIDKHLYLQKHLKQINHFKIYFDNKLKFIDFIDKFNDKTIDVKYEKYGIPFKGIIMLHGPQDVEKRL